MRYDADVHITDDPLITEIVQALADQEAAQLRAARAIVRARDDGVTWADLARFTGLSQDALRTRAASVDTSIRTRSRRERIQAAVEIPETEIPFDRELSVTEAAEALGISRASVHNRARRGDYVCRIDPSWRPPRLILAADQEGNPLKS